ncbi:hypothetical protein Q8G35_14900 [Peribacillus simplex]|uniref:Uncharacterized protein n=2 Tax=Peribacillus TaxID=2675229 RepID=A0AA90PHX4_9BACI|nr:MULTISPECIES: hypothetical protein [Peribacillus]MDP1419667.1 hypothetical protein [Peribacillus simplex]MDP1452680.1 hypothetical protein [Peribacillus frigoritolerans]
MRWFFAIIFILFGAFLFSLSIDGMGNIGHIIVKIIGFWSLLIAGFIVRNKKEKQQRLKQSGAILEQGSLFL